MILPRRVHVRLGVCAPLALGNVEGEDPCRGDMFGNAAREPDRTVVLVGEGEPLDLLVERLVLLLCSCEIAHHQGVLSDPDWSLCHAPRERVQALPDLDRAAEKEVELAVYYLLDSIVRPWL